MQVGWENMGDRRYVAIPGNTTHELPPLLVRTLPESAACGEVLDMAAEIIEAEDMIPDLPGAKRLEERKFDLALQLTEQYKALMAHWQWGDSILEWIRQCEITFEMHDALRSLLHPDVWPHASRSSFVTLLIDKHVSTPGVAVDRAVGLRLTFRQPPPIDCFSNQFLFYLNYSVLSNAYETWATIGADAAALLPPERFYFQVLDLAHS
jgi:hypothetical protein